jgi:hypothetical protein
MQINCFKKRHKGNFFKDTQTAFRQLSTDERRHDTIYYFLS